MERTCPDCGLTLSRLVSGGRLGCPTCYRIFAREVELAVEALHGVEAPPEYNPWPTRRSVARPASSPAPAATPAARPR